MVNFCWITSQLFLTNSARGSPLHDFHQQQIIKSQSKCLSNPIFFTFLFLLCIGDGWLIITKFCFRIRVLQAYLSSGKFEKAVRISLLKTPEYSKFLGAISKKAESREPPARPVLRNQFWSSFGGLAVLRNRRAARSRTGGVANVRPRRRFAITAVPRYRLTAQLARERFSDQSVFLYRGVHTFATSRIFLNNNKKVVLHREVRRLLSTCDSTLGVFFLF